MPQTVQPRPDERAFRGVITAYGLINRIMADHFGEFGISAAKWGVLRALQRAEGEGHPGLHHRELVDRLLVQPPGLSTLVQRLERDGLIAVRRDDRDARTRVVSLTARGRGLLKRALRVHAGRIADVMRGLERSEQVRAAVILDRLNEHLRTMLDDRAGTRGKQNGRPSRRIER